MLFYGEPPNIDIYVHPNYVGIGKLFFLPWLHITQIFLFNEWIAETFRTSYRMREVKNGRKTKRHIETVWNSFAALKNLGRKNDAAEKLLEWLSKLKRILEILPLPIVLQIAWMHFAFHKTEQRVTIYDNAKFFSSKTTKRAIWSWYSDPWWLGICGCVSVILVFEYITRWLAIHHF